MRVSQRKVETETGTSKVHLAKAERSPKYGVPDEENPEWTAERLKKATTYPNFPPEIMRIIGADQQKRGLQAAPKKQAISIRLSPDVLEALRATGPGWQARADDALRIQFLSK